MRTELPLNNDWIIESDMFDFDDTEYCSLKHLNRVPLSATTLMENFTVPYYAKNYKRDRDNFFFATLSSIKFGWRKAHKLLRRWLEDTYHPDGEPPTYAEIWEVFYAVEVPAGSYPGVRIKAQNECCQWAWEWEWKHGNLLRERTVEDDDDFEELETSVFESEDDDGDL